MEPLNGHLQVKPLKQGVISSAEGNEYEVVEKSAWNLGLPLTVTFDQGDIVIVEEDRVIKVNVASEEQYFVREDSILARIQSDPQAVSTQSA